MRVTVDRRELAQAARAVGRFLPRSTTLAILHNYLVEAHSGIIALTAFDHEAGRRVEVEAQVHEEGETLIPGALAPIVASGVGQDVELWATKGEVEIRTTVGRSTLRTGNRDDYPTTPEPEIEGDPITITAPWSRVRALANICAAKGKPGITGVLFEQGSAVATDSYRLAHTEVSESTDHPLAIVPAHAVGGLDAEVASLVIGDRHVKATLEDGAWWTRVIEDKFPRWRQFYEKVKPACTIRIDSESLSDAIKRAGNVVDTTSGHLLVTIEDGQAVLSARQTEVGEWSETLDCKVEGDVVPLGVRGSLLRSMVEPVEQVTIQVSNEYLPILIDGDDWWHGLQMPVRI